MLSLKPGSQLVHGLADNASGGLSPALDRSTTFANERDGSSPYGRGHAPVAAEAEALLGALEDAEATVLAFELADGASARRCEDAVRLEDVDDLWTDVARAIGGGA